jgi:hypothetical protein
MTLTFGSVFSGIGGLDKGFEDAGWKCVWQIEKDEYRRERRERKGCMDKEPIRTGEQQKIDEWTQEIYAAISTASVAGEAGFSSDDIGRGEATVRAVLLEAIRYGGRVQDSPSSEGGV